MLVTHQNNLKVLLSLPEFPLFLQNKQVQYVVCLTCQSRGSGSIPRVRSHIMGYGNDRLIKHVCIHSLLLEFAFL
jgi:hypothetical protein